MAKSKYRYKQYLNRAFWNSILAVLAALVAVLVVVFLWQQIKGVIGITIDNPFYTEQKSDSELEAIDKLRAEQPFSEAEVTQMLESLKDSDDSLSDAEQISQIDSLRSE